MRDRKGGSSSAASHLKRVEQFTYLGSVVQRNGIMNADVTLRIREDWCEMEADQWGSSS